MLRLTPGGPADGAAVAALLCASSLPALPADGRVRLVVARQDGRLIGVAGVEDLGSWGLLRSVAVDAASRGIGLGSTLVAAAEDLADGLDALYLLTTTAAPFFEARGYVRTKRAAVPPAVRASAEFAALCPDSAACLVKRLR